MTMPVKMLYSVSWKQAYGRDMSLLTSIFGEAPDAPMAQTWPLAFARAG